MRPVLCRVKVVNECRSHKAITPSTSMYGRTFFLAPAERAFDGPSLLAGVRCLEAFAEKENGAFRHRGRVQNYFQKN
jgi:hypothetical protein